MKRYQGIVYFRDGTVRKTGLCSDRMLAERMALQIYDQAMKMAIGDFFKPTRYEVVEVNG